LIISSHLIKAYAQSPPMFLVLLTFLIHLNLFLYILPPRLERGGNDFHLPSPLPFGLTYSLSAVPPTLCLFVGHSWQTTLWWCITPVMVYAIQAVKMSVYEVNETISRLESLKYRAPGA